MALVGLVRVSTNRQETQRQHDALDPICVRVFEDKRSGLGGDEFGLILYRVDEQEARRILDRLVAKVRGRRFGQHNVSSTISVGVVLATEANSDPDAVLAQADADRVKSDGGDAVAAAGNDPVLVDRRTGCTDRLPPALAIMCP